MMQRQFRRVAPNLYRAFLFFAVVNTALGLNFFILNPTTDPFGIPKELSGVAFLAVGIAQLALLHLSANLRAQRLVMATAISVMSMWGGILFVATFAQAVTSLQLPIVVLGLAYVGMSMLFTTPRKEQ